MKRYMFGLDGDYAASAKKLVELGYDSVVIGGSDPAPFEAAKAAGLETWLCFGAHSIGDFSQEKYGAVDANGEPAPWFGSACPNAAEVNKFNMDRAFETAKKVGVKGIFVDGARFASFANPEGKFNYFGCFCETCQKKMIKFGINAPVVKSTISDVITFLKGGEGNDKAPMLHDAVDAMFDFRGRCVAEYMRNFAIRCHAEGFDAGAFVFAPSLWFFVGQRPDALSDLDIVAPMLYRNYPHEEGPACLNHEWAAFRELMSGTARPAAEIASMLFDTAFISSDPMSGLSPEHVGVETGAARAMIAKRVKVMPIVQTEDEELEKTVSLVMKAGADGCGEFCFSQKKF